MQARDSLSAESIVIERAAQAGADVNTAPLLSVLLVSYNSKRYMDECLQSLQRHISVPFEAILVDNGSTDETAGYVRERYPWVRVFESASNLGFPGGNNAAAREARGEYLLLLNCDTILLTDIAQGIRILQKDARVGAVGARMYDEHGELCPNAGHFPAPWRLWKFASQWSKPFAEPFGDREFSAFRHDWVEGSLLLTPRSNWEAVGGMDESAFMYGEDVEFCAHTRQRGLLSVQCTKLMYLHFGGYTIDRMSHLYAGYRRFHASCSDKGTQRRAELVLLMGLMPRLAVFGALALVTRKPHFQRKFSRFWDVLRRWNELAPKPSTRAPVHNPREMQAVADGVSGRYVR